MSLTSTSSAWRRSAAVLETTGVFLSGTIAARLVLRSIGVATGSIRDAVPGLAVDYYALASARAVTLVVQYGLILGLAFLIGWWSGRRGASSYGVTTAGLSARAIGGIAAVLFSAGAFLPKLLIFAREHVSLGRAPRHWDLIASGDSPGFWIYMAVASFGLVPIVEELFFRGYVQTRLSDAFGAPAAVVMTALLSMLSHRQYLIASATGAGMMLSVFVAALFAGYVRFRYGTLLPGFVAHALGNVPVRGWVQPVLLVVMLLAVLAERKRILLHLRHLLGMMRQRVVITGSAVAVATVAAVLVVAALAPIALLPTGVAALAAALAIDARQKRTGRARSEALG